MFEDLENWSIKSCTIFKVNVGLRESNPDAYTPKMVSIGPYHKKNAQLRPMEKYKLLYLGRFLKRTEGLDVESCMSELDKLKEVALQCYEDLGNDSCSTDQFLQMLLLDGCFVVEFIRELSGMCPKGEDKIVNVGCVYHQVYRDLLLENQLPFFVLDKLHHMTKQVYELPLLNILFNYFVSSRKWLIRASFSETECNAGNFKHLLHALHIFSCHGNPKKKANDDLTWHRGMTNATELSEAGVSFAKVGNINSLSNMTSLFDIKLENGLMTVPCLGVVDDTETLLRNLIAYEQQSSDVQPKYFSDYTAFMDWLIDSDKDVNLLRQKGIIRNWIGEDKEVASFFNKIRKGVGHYLFRLLL